MNLSPAQADAVLRLVVAIIASGRWPTPEDVQKCVELSDELLGLGALLETGAEVIGTVGSLTALRDRRREARGEPPLTPKPGRP